jgi:hypothetical protein
MISAASLKRAGLISLVRMEDRKLKWVLIKLQQSKNTLFFFNITHSSKHPSGIKIKQGT